MEKNSVSGFKLGMTFSLKRARVSIYQDVMKALFNPNCFRFLINGRDRKLAIQVCQFGEDGFHIVPDENQRNRWYCYEITSIEMLRMIWKICGWHPDRTYRVFGKLHTRERIVEFDLKCAEMLSDRELGEL